MYNFSCTDQLCHSSCTTSPLYYSSFTGLLYNTLFTGCLYLYLGMGSIGIPPTGFLPWDSSHRDSSHTGLLPHGIPPESCVGGILWKESRLWGILLGGIPWEESCGRNSMTTMYWPNWPHYTKFLDTCAHFHYSLNYWYMSPFLDLSPEL